VFPLIGGQAITSVRAAEVLDVLLRVEARGALDTARRLKQSIGQVFRFAIANDWVDTDPSAHLTGALRPQGRRKHMPRVEQSELPGLVAAIRSYDDGSMPRRRETTRQALLFTLLTWARTGEVRYATWSEFEGLDELGAIPFWRVPAERMKMRCEHLVPLSRQAVAILRERARMPGRGRFVFSGDDPDRPMSENTMIYACYRMGYHGRQTVHGFRGLASTWANESGRYQSDWIETALAHDCVNKVRAAYNSALYLDRRRTMLQDWADHLESDDALKGLSRGIGGALPGGSPGFWNASSIGGSNRGWIGPLVTLKV
jgi:integrase